MFVIAAKPNIKHCYPYSKHQQYSGHRDALPNDTELRKGYSTLLERVPIEFFSHAQTTRQNHTPPLPAQKRAWVGTKPHACVFRQPTKDHPPVGTKPHAFHHTPTTNLYRHRCSYHFRRHNTTQLPSYTAAFIACTLHLHHDGITCYWPFLFKRQLRCQ
jgi:hypothetical protein